MTNPLDALRKQLEPVEPTEASLEEATELMNRYFEDLHALEDQAGAARKKAFEAGEVVTAMTFRLLAHEQVKLRVRLTPLKQLDDAITATMTMKNNLHEARDLLTRTRELS